MMANGGENEVKGSSTQNQPSSIIIVPTVNVCR